MVNALGSASSAYQSQSLYYEQTQVFKQTIEIQQKQDVVDIGGKGPVSVEDALAMVTERAIDKLKAVVDAARAKMGLGEDDPLDTSPEATANRIADFALNFFDNYAQNNDLANDEEGRQQFADFIGDAINQGIEEARGILESLQALNDDVSGNIDKTADLIQQRLDDFVLIG